MLFSEPKIPQSRAHSRSCAYLQRVSVLFSEPKIPQFDLVERNRLLIHGFSALQRAENSSIFSTRVSAKLRSRVSVLFSEPKIPQFSDAHRPRCTRAWFQCSSASRKFLNIFHVGAGVGAPVVFQCSSASRKFLNTDTPRTRSTNRTFQCSSASRKFLNASRQSPRRAPRQTFQCSSASRKFLNPAATRHVRAARCVSVLFSEPKIPQY